MVARGHRLPSDRSFAQDAIIREFFERDPDHVSRLIAEIAERLKADGRYTAEEVEAAAILTLIFQIYVRTGPCTLEGDCALSYAKAVVWAVIWPASWFVYLSGALASSA
jgi:hypothetical protein